MENLQPGSRVYQAMTAVAYCAGLRLSEAVMPSVRSLTLPEEGWGRIDVTEADISFDEPGEPKTGQRRVPIPPVLVDLLRRWIEDNNLSDPADLLFRTAKGTRPSTSNWGRAWHPALAMAGHAANTTSLGFSRMPVRHNRIPVAEAGQPESLSLQVEFDWHFVGKIRLLSETPLRLELPDVRYPGVYRLTASLRDGSVADDIWYVGQSMDQIDTRIRRHLREEFHEQTQSGKRFLERLRDPNGWCQLEEARNIRLNGSSDLVGLKDGCFDAKTIEALPQGWLSAAQFVMNVVESTGQVGTSAIANPQGVR